MFKISTLFLFLTTSFLYTQEVAPFIEITDSQDLNNILIDCNYPLDADRCFTLQANFTTILETTDYSVENIPFSPPTGLTNETIVNINEDDTWGEVLPLPFNFCFYNEGYNELIIGDNGIISFNQALAFGDNAFAAATIPNASMPTNAIFGAFHDLTNDTNVFGCTDDPATPENECGDIKTYITGVAPQRIFVISYENLNHFSCEGIDERRSSSQIVLYESSNIIDIYIQDKPLSCETNFRRNALIGIQNQDGTLAVTPPNRNTSIWSTTNEAWRFTPNGIPATVIQWEDQDRIGFSNNTEITVCPEENTFYYASVTYEFCNGEELVLEDIININIALTFPIAIDNEVTVCDINTIGEETIDLETYTPLMVGTQTGLALSYYDTLDEAQNSTNPISDPNNFILNTPTDVIYVRLQRGVGCFDVGELTLNLLELGTSQINTISVCDIDNDNSEFITLTDYSTQIIGSQSGINIEYYPTLLDAQSDTNPITEITAANGDSVFIKFTLQPDDSCPNIEEIDINLNGEPVVAAIEETLCSNLTLFDLTAQEIDVQTTNTETLSFSYHLRETWAIANINPFDPMHPTNPIDPEFYPINSATTTSIWVRSVTSNGCVKTYPINFTFIEGVTVTNDAQVSTGDVFDLTESITDMVADLTGITVEYYNSEAGAETRDPASQIANPTTYQINNPEAEVFIVFINDTSGCETVGTVELETVGFGGGGGPSGGGVCDNNNDNTELVDLTTYSESIIAGYDNAQYMEVTYHILETDANTNANANTELIVTSPITIYARIALVFENVELDAQVIEFTLNFQPTSQIAPVNRSICDELSNRFEDHDITQYEDDFSTESGVTFEYFNTNGTAINTPENFRITGVPRTIDVTINIPGRCPVDSELIIDFYPEIETNNAVLQGCDIDSDGEHTFNLNDALIDVNVDFALYEATYYLTLNEARAGDPANQIVDPANYVLTTNAPVYVRLYNTTTTCYNTARINLEIIPVPQQLVSSINICDFNNDTNETNIDLTSFNRTIIGTQRNVTITYYANLTDVTAETNPITTIDLSNTNTTIYIALSAPDGCIYKNEIDLILIPSPIVEDISVTVCDNFTDGEEIYNLTDHNSEFVTDDTGLTFRYFTTENNALNNTGVINSTAYPITSVPLTLYTRVTNSSSTCFSIAEMTIDYTFPVAVSNAELSACDNDFNLSEVFDLSTAIPDMLADTSGLEITYYTNELAAETADNAFLITTPSSYNSETADVYVRFFSPITKCFSIGIIELEVLAIPKLINNRYSICDTDIDGDYTLDLAEINPLIIQDQTGLDFTYYTNFSKAETETNPITNTTNYTIPTDNHTIYVRVLNDSDCWSVASVEISIRTSVTVETVTDVLEACDDDKNTFSIFDLTSFEDRVTLETGATFRYYNTEADAKLEQNEITNPTSHQNTTPNTQTVFVRVSVTDKCDDVTSFTIQTINITPPILTEASFCAGTSVDLDIGDYATYDWSTGEASQIINVDTPGTYTVTLTDTKGCIGTFDVNVEEIPLPLSFATSITECDYDGTTDGLTSFNLNDYNNQLTGNNNNVTTQFFLSQDDLDNDRNPQNTNFTNTTNPQTLYVKVIDNDGLRCFSSTQLTLNVSLIDLSPAIIEVCDELDSPDGINPFDLTLATPQVLENTSEPLDVVYYETLTNAEIQTAPLNVNYTNKEPYSQTLYARVENSNNCVYFEEVLLVVNDLPNLEDDEETIYCLNDYPNTIELESGINDNNTNNYTYLWSTGETSEAIDINEIGTYNVTITSLSGCSKSRTITVIPSSSPTIDSIDIEDGTTINTITVYASGDGDYEYALEASGSYQDSHIFTNIQGGLYTIYVRDKNNCGIASMRVSVVSAPKFFTPNADTYNDTWIPNGLSKQFQSNVSLHIFDRHGKLLKTLDPFGNGWGGDFNNELMPTDDYWFSLNYIETFSGRQRQIKGHFTLKR